MSESERQTLGVALAFISGRVPIEDASFDDLEALGFDMWCREGRPENNDVMARAEEIVSDLLIRALGGVQ